MSERRYSPIDGIITTVDRALRTSLASSGRPDRGRLPSQPTRSALLDAHAAVTAQAAIEAALASKRDDTSHDDTAEQRALRDAMHTSGTSGNAASLLVYAGAYGVGHTARLIGDSASLGLRNDARQRTQKALAEAAERLAIANPRLPAHSIWQPGKSMVQRISQGYLAALNAVFDTCEKISRVFTRL